jgi:hypothetical protein
MAHFYRLVFLTLFILLGCIRPVFADTVVYNVYWYLNSSSIFPSLEQACLSSPLTTSGWTFTGVTNYVVPNANGLGGAGRCNYHNDQYNTNSGINVTSRAAPLCPDGQSRDSVTNVCHATCNPGSIPGPLGYSSTSMSGSRCVNGCTQIPQGVSCGFSSSASAPFYCTATSMTMPGSSCAPTSGSTGDTPAPPPTNSPPQGQGDCPSGTSYGVVNGVGVCLANNPGGPPPPNCPAGTVQQTVSGTSTCVPASGSGSSSQDNTTNPDGSTTETTTTTECKGGTCTTTTTTSGKNTDGTGKTPSTITDNQDQNSFCKTHPTDPVCKGATGTAVFGDCNTPPVCTGDAIQCAVANQAFQHRCADQKASDAVKDSAQKALGDLIIAGNDPLKSSMPGNVPTPEVNVGTGLNSDGWMGGGNCFQDFTVSIPGGSITIPFSRLCDMLLALRAVVMLLAGLTSFRILSDAISGS